MIWKNQRLPGSIPVRVAARHLNVSKSGFYRWLRKKGCNSRAARDKPVVEGMMKIAIDNPHYGYRRMRRELGNHGILANDKRIRRLMKENGLVIKRKRYSPITTDSEHANPVYPNLVRGMEVTGPNQVWAADFTYIWLRTGFAYLAVEIDIYSRRCIGWSLSTRLDTNTALDALQMALYNRRDENLSGLIHHSDRGRQYTSFEFTQCLRNHGIQVSNSRKGNPYDNAFAESFFKTLKCEEVYLNEYETYDQALKNIERFIEDVYNEKRMHSALGYISPAEFEEQREVYNVAIP